jgi:hypothetical protein
MFCVTVSPRVSFVPLFFLQWPNEQMAFGVAHIKQNLQLQQETTMLTNRSENPALFDM